VTAKKVAEAALAARMGEVERLEGMVRPEAAATAALAEATAEAARLAGWVAAVAAKAAAGH